MNNTFLDRIAGVLKQEMSNFLDFPENENKPKGVEAVKAVIGNLAVEKHQTQKKLSTLSATIASLESKSSTAVELNRDDLARAGLKQKHSLEKEKAQLENRVKEITQDIEKLNLFLETDAQKSPMHSEQTKQFESLLAELDALASDHN
ncbi:PspA/IM30 family protein [Hirschia maritima]|uniref:PspA/IM30 family protein n=1 Tax=Hirschia maritima TaxID=1121961 RepID=UPI000380216F|nr:hypothetical protein [Hirschia maritima]